MKNKTYSKLCLKLFLMFKKIFTNYCLYMYDVLVHDFLVRALYFTYMNFSTKKQAHFRELHEIIIIKCIIKNI